MKNQELGYPEPAPIFEAPEPSPRIPIPKMDQEVMDYVIGLRYWRKSLHLDDSLWYELLDQEIRLRGAQFGL